MFLARLALATVVDEASARDGESCPVFTAKLKIFEKSAASNPSTVDLKEITEQTFEIINALGTPVMEGEQIIVGQGVDERWFTLPRAHPKFQFVTQGKIADREVEVKVLRTMNSPPNLEGSEIGQPLQYGDTLTIYDPFNLWSDIEEEATGWAYLAYAQDDVPTTSGSSEQHVARYEIEECSLPINEIEGELTSCLMGGMEEGTAMVDLDAGAARSSYPNVDEPPDDETTTSGSGTELDFKNPWKLDGIEGSKCVLRRITNLKPSDPENYTAPKARSSTEVEWQVVSIEKKIARHIRVSKSGGSWTETEAYDGFSIGTASGDCTQNIRCDLCECDNPDDEGYAFLNTTSNSVEYIVYSTKSAFYGPADTFDVLINGMNFSGCDLAYTKVSAKLLCVDYPYPQNTTIPTSSYPVVTDSTIGIEDCGSCVWTWKYNTDCASAATCNWIFSAVQGWEEAPENNCDEGCSCSVQDIPLNNNGAPWEEGNTYQTICRDESPEWVKTQDCSAGCTCSEPLSSLDGTTIGETKSADCTGTRSDTGTSSALCITNQLANITVLDCPEPSPAGTTQSCIPITDECPPEETP